MPSRRGGSASCGGWAAGGSATPSARPPRRPAAPSPPPPPRPASSRRLPTTPAPRPPPRRSPPPPLEPVVVPLHPDDRGALHAALTQLAEQDPLIGLREGEETSVTLYGEVQKEVIEATLADDFGVAVDFRETTTICIERVTGTG